MKEKKLEMIKQKYNNIDMEDKIANSIKKLEFTNSIVKKSAFLFGILFVIDLIVPDPIFGIDEILFGAITTTTTTASSIITNKINDLALDGSTKINNKEITDLKNVLLNLASAKKNKNSSKK